MKKKIIEYFEFPEEAESVVDLILTKDEKKLIELMDDNEYTFSELKELICDNFDCDIEAFISRSYKRVIINKIPNRELTMYCSATFYDRLAIFAQYENDLWNSVPEEQRQKIDEWYLLQYVEGAKPRVEKFMKDKTKLIENAYFYTLEESIEVIKNIDRKILLVPCNCKSVAQNCKNEKPNNVCLLFQEGVNTMADRGYDTYISKEEAIEVLKKADKAGLMHTSEAEEAICNCCGCCCYPIRAAKILGVTGHWPKRIHSIVWDKESCINCGKCVKVCNFGAFSFDENKKIQFDESKCLGCTIYVSNCPKDVISVVDLN